MNKTTAALSETWYKTMIKTISEGVKTDDPTKNFRPNPAIAALLQVQGNLGVRISDLVTYEGKDGLKLADIIQDGEKKRLDITEQKTGKRRTFEVREDLYNFILQYAVENNIGKDKPLFPFRERYIQRIVKQAADYLGFENIGTHSFRKYAVTKMYKNSGNNIIVAQRFAQHASARTTQRYIGIEDELFTKALDASITLV